MNDLRRTKKDLCEELERLRARVAQLEQIAADPGDAARDLSLEAERLNASLDGTTVGLWDWDIPSGHATFVRHWGIILGYAPSECEDHIGMWERNVHPDDKGWVTKALEDHLAGRTPIYETVHRLRARNGEYRWVLDRGKVIRRDKDGRPLRAVGMHMDVTDQKRIEHLNERLREEIAQRERVQEALYHQRMESLVVTGRLAAGVAHEVNNPLQGIVAQLRLLSDDLPPELRKSRRLRSINDNIRQISRIVKGLLDLHREPEGGECCNASVVLNSLMDLVGAQLRLQGIAIGVRVNPENVSIPVSAKTLTQVLLNLILNAQDAMPDGGRIELALDRNNDEVRITVSDTGAGIPPDVRAKVFSPFFTTKGPKGTGLGLSVTHSLVTNAGGRIEILDHAGGGAAFCIRFPSVSTDEKPAQSLRGGTPQA